MGVHINKNISVVRSDLLKTRCNVLVHYSRYAVHSARQRSAHATFVLIHLRGAQAPLSHNYDTEKNSMNVMHRGERTMQPLAVVLNMTRAVM